MAQACNDGSQFQMGLLQWCSPSQNTSSEPLSALNEKVDEGQACITGKPSKYEE